MVRLVGVVERRRRLVLAVWGLTFVVALLPFSKETSHLTTGGFEVPGSESHRVEAASKLFPSVKPNAIGVLLLPPAGARVTPAEVTAARAAIGRAVSGVAHVSLASAAQTVISPDGSAAQIAINGPEDEDKAKDAATALRPRLPAQVGTSKLYFVGQPAIWSGYDIVSKQSLKSAEAVGLPLTGLILIAVFGSLAAAFLPLALGVVSIVVTGAIIYAIGAALPMSQFVSNIASLIGIAVGVDYTLFILVRYRRELEAGHSPPDALRAALGTSGRAVLFSGLTVMLALAGLFLVDSIALRSMALGAILVVAVAVLGALTLTPAAIITLGERLHGPSPRVSRALARLRSLWRGRGDGFWERWSERVARRPWLSLVAAIAVLVTLAIPAFSMRTTTEALPQLPTSSPERVGAEQAVRHFGPAASGNVYVLESYAGQVNPAVEQRVAAVVRADPGVVEISQPIQGLDLHQVLLSVTTQEPAESAATRALVTRLHHALVPLSRRATGVTVSLGGTTAHELQFDSRIGGSLWVVVVFVLLACALVILLLLRSIVLPLKAIAMNILTVGASFGVLVALFQWKWFNSVLGLEAPGYVSTLALPFVLAIMFGLSMDYEVFLLASVEEEYSHTKDTRAAVERALRATGPTITSAAAIMVIVFLAFVGVSLATIKMIGVGLAVAVALDATIVRLVLVPSAVVLMGEANWWMPRSFRQRSDRTTPTVAALKTKDVV
jgi:uncharacterized membrane protein YdfJ with MMPL/SSD domain